MTYPLKPGKLTLPFTVMVAGRPQQATLKATVKPLTSGSAILILDKARATLGGKTYVLTDTAMQALLRQTGHMMSGENSSPASILHLGWQSAVPLAMTADAAGLRVMTKRDFSSGTIYFREGRVAAERIP